jgi:hypothetical protein
VKYLELVLTGVAGACLLCALDGLPASSWCLLLIGTAFAVTVVLAVGQHRRWWAR